MVDIDDTYDPYVVLAVSRDASHEEIKKARNALHRIYHPDRPGKPPDATARTAEVNRAWEALETPAARQATDDRLDRAAREREAARLQAEKDEAAAVAPAGEAGWGAPRAARSLRTPLPLHPATRRSTSPAQRLRTRLRTRTATGTHRRRPRTRTATGTRRRPTRATVRPRAHCLRPDLGHVHPLPRPSRRGAGLRRPPTGHQAQRFGTGCRAWGLATGLAGSFGVLLLILLAGTASDDVTADRPTAAEVDASWAQIAEEHRGSDGSRVDVACPPGGSPLEIWGTGPYTDGSSVCTAAVHSGLITFAGGGTVTIEIGPGQELYATSRANGVESQVYGPWFGSFTFPEA